MKLLTGLLVTTITFAAFTMLGSVAFAQEPGGAPAAPAAPAGGASASKAAVCDGVKLTGGDCAQNAESSVGSIIKQAINVLSILIGVAAVIMIMIGGFKYITSNGDANSIQSAKNTILYALIGLVVVALAQTMVIFVLKKVNEGTNTTTTTTTTTKPAGL